MMEKIFFVKKQLAKKHKIIFFLLAAGAGIAAMLPVYLWGVPTGADFDNHLRFGLPFYEELARGNLIPAWLAESNYGFGDPRFRFYPPVLYYVLSFFRFLSGDWYFALLLTLTFFYVIGAIGVYLWTRQGLSDRTAVLAAWIFTFLPYHSAQIYQASLLAEFAAISFLPFAFMFVERLTSANPDTASKRLFNLSGLAIFYALIVTTHIPTTVLVSLSLGLFALFLTDWKNYKKGLVLCAVGIFLGLMLSAGFWGKMISELSLIQAGEKVSSDYYDYRNNFVFSPFALTNLNVWFANWISVLTIGIFLPVLLIIRQLAARRPNELTAKYFHPESENATLKKRLMVTTILTGLTFLMITDLSRPLWTIIPKLKDIQFPFRWLIVVSVLISPLVALALEVWRERLKQKNLRAAQFILILGFAAAAFFTVQDLIFDSEYLTRQALGGRLEIIRGAPSFNDWLPRNAREVKDLMPINGQAEAGKRAVVINDWQSEKRHMSIAEGSETEVRLRTYYYPLWKAFQLKDGQRLPLPVNAAGDGTLVVSIPPENTEIEVLIVETPIVRSALFVSALGGLLFFSLTAIGVFLRKRSS